MLIALAVIWVGFNIASGGLFLSPRNLWNLSVQTATIAILANGMVLIIVSRNIDLSVGSLLGFIGMMMAVTQARDRALACWVGQCRCDLADRHRRRRCCRSR